MRHLTAKNIPIAFLGISVLIIGIRFFTILSFPDTRTLDKGDIVKIFPGQTLSQKFTASRDNLKSIQFLLRTPGLKDGDTIIIKLADVTCTNTLREGELTRPFLNTDDMYVFAFPRITDSKGETYCLLLSYRTSSTSNKYLRFFTTHESNPSLLLMNSATNEPLNGESLSLRTVYRNNHWWEDLHELNQRISQYKPWFLKDFYIGTVTVLFVVLSVVLIATLIYSTPLQKKQKP